jgi:hypothetical protein
MSAIIGSLFASFWPYIIAGLGALATAAGLYFKGRSDAKGKAIVADIKQANEILKGASDARSRVDSIKPVSGVMPDDGFRRD